MRTWSTGLTIWTENYYNWLCLSFFSIPKMVEVKNLLHGCPFKNPEIPALETGLSSYPPLKVFNF